MAATVRPHPFTDRRTEDLSVFNKPLHTSRTLLRASTSTRPAFPTLDQAIGTMLANLREYQLTLLGRSLLLIGGEIFANIACWIVAILLFLPHTGGDVGGLLSLAMLSWVCKNGTFMCILH